MHNKCFLNWEVKPLQNLLFWLVTQYITLNMLFNINIIVKTACFVIQQFQNRHLLCMHWNRSKSLHYSWEKIACVLQSDIRHNVKQVIYLVGYIVCTLCIYTPIKSDMHCSEANLLLIKYFYIFDQWIGMYALCNANKSLGKRRSWESAQVWPQNQWCVHLK